MKLRLRGQSLRLRLNQSEVEELVKAGRVEEAVQIGVQPESRLVYRLCLSVIHEQATAAFLEQQINVFLPANSGQQWATGDTIGLYGETPCGLRLMIEKDFKCLASRPDEDDSDAYDNPGGVAHVGCGANSD